MKNLAIIPARSGSKGLRDKNIKELCGVPLIGYTIKAAYDSQMFNTVMVSTDDSRYAEIAKKCGAEVPFIRSANNSGDSSSSWEVVYEVLYKYLQLGERFDTVCLLQPTSPLRTSSDIINSYAELTSRDGVNAVTSVCEVSHSPEWMMVLDDDLSLKKFRDSMQEKPRQELKKYYQLNGAIYIRKLVYSNDSVLLCDDNEIAYIMNQNNSVDIDTLVDFQYVEFLISNLVFNK